MKLRETRARVRKIEVRLAQELTVRFHTFERNGRRLHVSLTDRLRKNAEKEALWRSRELAVTLNNAAYGYDEMMPRSGSGRDGIFLMDRSFRPVSPMMRKLFDGFLDKKGSGAQEIAADLSTSVADLLPVRLVSHHMRLLGVLHRADDVDSLILVDCDRSA